MEEHRIFSLLSFVMPQDAPAEGEPRPGLDLSELTIDD